MVLCYEDSLWWCILFPWLKMTVVCVCVWDSQSKRKAGAGRIVVRRYKEGVYISYIVVRPNINTEMAK